MCVRVCVCRKYTVTTNVAWKLILRPNIKREMLIQLFEPLTHTYSTCANAHGPCVHVLYYCCVAFSGCKNELKVKRLILCCQTVLGHTLGFITPPHPTNQTVGWLITPPPLPSAHRWDVRLKVDGEQHGVWCFTPSYRLDFGLETAPLSTFTLLPHAICTLQVSFHCCRSHMSLQGPAEDSFQADGVFQFDFEWFMKCLCVLMVLWFYSVLLKESPKLSDGTTADRGVSHL